MTAFGSMETAVAALRSGAYDFLTKPIESDLLAAGLDRAIKAPSSARHGATTERNSRSQSALR